ncbi:hypothetical protein [Acinetobacter sp.]|uniref:hypothetical protein n=1 Tax=Acinetobacter sp. TaxID=472 RepID=UPI0035B19606
MAKNKKYQPQAGNLIKTRKVGTLIAKFIEIVLQPNRAQKFALGKDSANQRHGKHR